MKTIVIILAIIVFLTCTSLGYLLAAKYQQEEEDEGI
jgi:DNA-binding transcriptional regulator of glucitol operon